MGPLLPFHERQHAEYLNYRPDPFRLFLMSFPGGLILQANVACDIFRMRQYAGLTLSQPAVVRNSLAGFRTKQSIPHRIFSIPSKYMVDFFR